MQNHAFRLSNLQVCKILIQADFPETHLNVLRPDVLMVSLRGGITKTKENWISKKGGCMFRCIPESFKTPSKDVPGTFSYISVPINTSVYKSQVGGLRAHNHATLWSNLQDCKISSRAEIPKLDRVWQQDVNKTWISHVKRMNNS